MAGASVGIHSLPDDVLQRILGLLVLEERCEAASAVCRRWRDACFAPELLRSIDVTLAAVDVAGDAEEQQEEAADFMERLHSLARWLAARAAPRVETLRLEVDVRHLVLTAEQRTEAAALVLTMLVACGCPGGRLSDVVLRLEGLPVLMDAWLAPLAHSLRRLSITVIEGVCRVLHVPFPALQELTLGASPLRTGERFRLEPEASLPSSLCSLELLALGGDSLPPQVGSLTRLSQLIMLGGQMTSGGYAPLEQLAGSLRRLRLLSSEHVPSCLDQLTALQGMTVLPNSLDDGGGHVTAALPALASSLTSLVLGSTEDMAEPPAELSRLTRLRQFAWSGDSNVHATLPGGPWLAGLVRLAAPSVLLDNSRRSGSLQLAANVEDVGIALSPSRGSDVLVTRSADAALQWAAALPFLLSCNLFSDRFAGEDRIPAGVAAHLARAQRERPDALFGVDSLMRWMANEPEF